MQGITAQPTLQTCLPAGDRVLPGGKVTVVTRMSASVCVLVWSLHHKAKGQAMDERMYLGVEGREGGCWLACKEVVVVLLLLSLLGLSIEGVS